MLSPETETIGVTVTLGKSRLDFHLKLINTIEEGKIRQRFIGDDDKSFENNVAVLSELETTPIELTTGGEKSEISAKDYFQQKSVSKERIAEYAIRGYFVAIQPDVSFTPALG